MRVLYISGAQGPDYQCDMLFHGLRSLLGPNVVDAERIWYAYADAFGAGRHDRSQLYGRGFTMYGLLEPDEDIDRTDVARKIRAHYYDLVIYGSIHRCRSFLRETLDSYRPHEILFVDGEDEPFVVSELIHCGVYFKREMPNPFPGVFPIQFAIPEEKIRTVSRPKIKLLAFIDPRDRSTYIHPDEVSYYGDYAESLFAITQKKAGWDCLRHYEIMANRCIPWFLDLNLCPSTTLIFLPKQELLAANRLLNTRGLGFFETNEGAEKWLALQQRIDNVLRQDCTTRALARYVIEIASAVKTSSHSMHCGQSQRVMALPLKP